MAIQINDLADAVADALREYRQDLTEKVKSSVRSSAKACVAELQTTSPEDTGSYRKGWRATKAYESSKAIRMQVHNKDNGSLTWLLEDGHAKVSGGRVPGKPHIQPAADNAAKLLPKDVEMRVRKK